MSTTRTLAAAFGAGALLLFSACSADATDFKAAAEKGITGSDGLGDGSSAECEEPADGKVGTTFTCTGTAADGTVVEFVATISDSKTVTVSAAGVVEGGTDDGTEDTEVTEDTTGS